MDPVSFQIDESEVIEAEEEGHVQVELQSVSSTNAAASMYVLSAVLSLSDYFSAEISLYFVTQCRNAATMNLRNIN